MKSFEFVFSRFFEVEKVATKVLEEKTHSFFPLSSPFSLSPSLSLSQILTGGLRDSFLVDGVAFRKTFSYAGFEMQPKRYENPLVLALNIELELKAEKDNAEVRLDDPSDYQAVVDAEW